MQPFRPQKSAYMGSPRFTMSPDGLRPLGEHVADAVRTAILRGTFRPGEKLDQQEIADELSVSRIPVREALRTLDAEGLVTIVPNRGANVTERSKEELAELFFIRGLLEGAAAERAARSMDEDTLDRLAAIVEQAEDTDDREELLVLNNDFHITMYSVFPQPEMVNYIQQLRNKVAPYNQIYLDTQGSKEAAWNEHRKILEACADRDGTRARLEMERHLARVIESILSASGEQQAVLSSELENK
jgi:DNA-binding GntR family transcriptional regulator